MDPVGLLKALLIHAAYEGACAVCEPLIRNPDGTEVQLDPLIQDVSLKQKGLLVYEEAKVQYTAILRLRRQERHLPDPVVAAAPVGTAARRRDSTPRRRYCERRGRRRPGRSEHNRQVMEAAMRLQIGDCRLQIFRTALLRTRCSA